MDPGRLSLQHLHCLVVLVDECHVTRAAEKVGVTENFTRPDGTRIAIVFKRVR